jgi:hypothetical protein
MPSLLQQWSPNRRHRTLAISGGNGQPPAEQAGERSIEAARRGYPSSQNTWEPAAHLNARVISEFNEARMGLDEETENDDSSAGEESESEGEQPAAPRPPAKKRRSVAAPAPQPVRAPAVGKRATRPAPLAPDSSDEEAAQPKAKQRKAQPKAKGKARPKSKGK